MREYTVIIPELFEGDPYMRVSVDKTGGGTLGSSYTGEWTARWYRRGFPIVEDTLRTGTPKTHEEVAAIALSFWVSEMDTEEDWATHDRVMYYTDSILD